MRRPLSSTVALVLLAAGALAACSDDDPVTTATTTATGDTDGDEAAAGGNECTAGNTLADGVLTIATDTPAFPPWFIDDDPTSGEGFESAVAYAVAEELGYGNEQVEWVVAAFNSVIAPGEKPFDFAINQVSISEERDQAVDFSDGYYDVNQAIVGFADSEAAGATTVADLQGLRLGAQVGTTSLDFITEVIEPAEEPFVYNDNASAKAALDAGQVDGIVLDLPTAFFVSAVEIEGTAVIGQFPSTGDEPEQFGMVFDEGNPLRDCVNEALAAVEERGDLDAIEQQWLSDTVDAPVIDIE
ncbi:MAG: amino acid ABC transporter substrate-binding protein [Acidimicrobiia bacterium]|nr:amino acid ABC transporter substrate-binding protein [Acidimicrobiia bacterium]